MQHLSENFGNNWLLLAQELAESSVFFLGCLFVEYLEVLLAIVVGYKGHILVLALAQIVEDDSELVVLLDRCVLVRSSFSWRKGVARRALQESSALTRINFD